MKVLDLFALMAFKVLQKEKKINQLLLSDIQMKLIGFN